MNLADPELEVTDPTPNVHALFVHFDALFFWAKLAGKAVVRWSKRMYSCAGVCSYEGRGGICDIALSEPLLKLRPRKDLCETLLHEMIHAYLFIINRDQSRDGHGPNFLAHMHRINKATRLNISVYHDFHDEVKLYQTHYWRCNGICQKLPPYFGVVRRSMNRAPGPTDFWWKEHMRKCGGTFVKFKEPEKPVKKSRNKVIKPNSDITKYINNNKPVKNKNTDNITNKDKVKGLKDILNEKTNTINNKAVSPTSTIRPSVFTGTGQTVGSKKVESPKQVRPPVFTGSGHTLGGSNNVESPKPIVKPAVIIGNSQTTSIRNRSNSVGVVETVRNIWANKTILSAANAVTKKGTSELPALNANKKRLSDNVLVGSPPNKLKKFDDYFKATATSILKDIYGKDFQITQSKETNKLIAVQSKTQSVSDIKNENVHCNEILVDCPICKTKVSDKQINAHIDECLNTNIIEDLSKESIVIQPSTSQSNSNQKLKKRRETVGVITAPDTEPHISLFKPKPGNNVENGLKSHNIGNTTNDLKVKPDVKVEDLNKADVQIKLEPGTSKEIDEQNICPCCGDTIDKPVQDHLDKCLMFFDNNTTIPAEGASISFGDKTITIDDSDEDLNKNDVQIKVEPGTSNEIDEQNICPCCGNTIDKPVQEHLDECLMFFDNNITVPEEGASTSFGDRTIIIDDSDDEFDETQIFNATGTKSPCPCCMKMIENVEMNDHLDSCLGLKD